jgi:DNA-binding NarL/FixJ family response regulator
MATEPLASGADSLHPSRVFDHRQRRPVANDERMPPELRLRQAPAREAALLRESDDQIRNLHAWREAAAIHVAGLTPRQRRIMELVLAGHSSEGIAADLGISQRNVENNRAAILPKTSMKSLPGLTRLALAATGNLIGSFRG